MARYIKIILPQVPETIRAATAAILYTATCKRMLCIVGVLVPKSMNFTPFLRFTSHGTSQQLISATSIVQQIQHYGTSIRNSVTSFYTCYTINCPLTSSPNHSLYPASVTPAATTRPKILKGRSRPGRGADGAAGGGIGGGGGGGHHAKHGGIRSAAASSTGGGASGGGAGGGGGGRAAVRNLVTPNKSMGQNFLKNPMIVQVSSGHGDLPGYM